MKTSETVTKLAAALLAAQRQITFASKDATNPHFKNRYADLPAVIDAIKPALNEAGIVFVQMMAPSDRDSLAMTTRLMHESGEWIESTATCPLPKADPQGYGSAATYLRRYTLAAAVGLYQDDDDGNAASRTAQAPVQQQDNSPKARAARLTAGVADGDAVNAALACSGWPQKTQDEVWALLDAETADQLTKHWPKG